ncbi:MAG: hypothetical protein Q4A71_00410 [Actinomycetaceae bacterium]|nr:hypothetical protein [Actinomycetaceae bacterium]
MQQTKRWDDIEELLGSSGGGGHCDWQGGYCSGDVTHTILYVTSEGPSPATYCVRHYTLELANLIETHLPCCRDPLSAHICGWGPIEDPYRLDSLDD